MSFGLFKPSSPRPATPDAATATVNALTPLNLAPWPAETPPLCLTELLSTRFSHDITGTIGAIHNGVELLDDPASGMQKEALDLVSASARRAIAAITFYRQAYGRIGQGDMPVDSVAMTQTIRAFFSHQTQVALDLPAAFTLTSSQSRILLNSLLLALDGLPRGGQVQISMPEGKLSILAKGSVQYKPEVQEVLEGRALPAQLTPKSIQPYLLLLMLKEAGTRAFYQLQPDQFLLEYHFTA